MFIVSVDALIISAEMASIQRHVTVNEYFIFIILAFTVLKMLAFFDPVIKTQIFNCAYRISVVAGYMASEIQGMSAFKFMHKDDVLYTIVALRESK